MQSRDRLYQDLLENVRFVRWVTGEAPDDESYWQNWAANDSIRQEVMAQARLTILTLQGKPVTLSKQDIADRVQQALSKAKYQESLTGRQPVRVRYIARYRWAAAASLIFLLGLGWFTYTQYVARLDHRQVGQIAPRLGQPDQPNRFVTIANSDRPARHVVLPDGSSVVLRKHSQVRYARVFAGGKREVTLSGEAFFEVTKDPTKPFFVYANGLVTKVLGTSFTVKAHRKAERVVVTVRTGKVAVFAQTDAKAEALRNSRDLTGLVLMPNQQATFERTDARLTRTEVALPVKKPSFDFKATPIADVFAALEKAYGITIVFDREIMAHCSLSATLGDEPLQKKLQWITTILEASYQIKGQEIIINGKPCQ